MSHANTATSSRKFVMMYQTAKTGWFTAGLKPNKENGGFTLTPCKYVRTVLTASQLERWAAKLGRIHSLLNPVTEIRVREVYDK